MQGGTDVRVLELLTKQVTLLEEIRDLLAKRPKSEDQAGSGGVVGGPTAPPFIDKNSGF